MAGSAIGDCGDFLKAFPQYTERDYMYKLSFAKIQFLMTDSTHHKYLEGDDKKKWEQYCKRNKEQDIVETQIIKSVKDLRK